MDEFIREVDEEYRRERVLEIWRRFGALIVGAALLLVAAVGGWRYWQHQEGQRAEAAALRFDEAVQLSRGGKGGEAEKALEDLAANGPAGYRGLARFRLAAELAKDDGDKGAAAYDALANDSALDSSLRDLARVRAAGLRIEAPGGAAASERGLEAFATPANPWRNSAREILGVAALKRGDFDAAGRWFDQIAADREAPSNLRARLEIYSALVAGGPVQTAQ